MYVLKFIVVIYFVNCVCAWDSEQLEVFDAVDEIKENFYALLNVTQDASNQEIKSAYRALTLKLHPDKNPDVDTSVQFRNLVSVYEILRNPTKRKYYNEVVINGLPNWRSAVYYYRYVRKMGMAEACIILFVIFTIAQYLINWGAYLERKITLEQNLSKKRKVNKVTAMIESELNNLQRPSFLNTLPFQIPKAIFRLIISIPSAVVFLKIHVKERIEEINTPPTPEEESVPIQRPKTARKRNKGFVMPEGPNFETTTNISEQSESSSAPPPPMASGGLWTDDDLDELTRLMKKYPGGTSGRWELISEAMARSVPEVTFMANRMKEQLSKPAEEEELVPVKVKQKTRKDGDEEGAKKWSQAQQKSLEDALAKYPRGHAERWDKISECVPNKTKEECMARFKFIVEGLQKQKQENGTVQSGQ